MYHIQSFHIHLLLTLIFAFLLSNCSTKTGSEYTGRYKLNDGLVLNVYEKNDALFLRPSMWRSIQYLQPSGIDSFYSRLHSQIKFTYNRNSEGAIISLEISGHDEIGGTAEKMSAQDTLAIEFLEMEKIDRAIATLNNPTEEQITSLGFKLVSSYPSKVKSWVSFAKHYESEFPNSAALKQIIGIGSLMAGNRAEALQALEEAYRINPEDTFTASCLTLLGSTKVPDEPKG